MTLQERFDSLFAESESLAQRAEDAERRLAGLLPVVDDFLRIDPVTSWTHETAGEVIRCRYCQAEGRRECGETVVISHIPECLYGRMKTARDGDEA